ncbi:MAG: hydrolase [Syntrophales bacterium]|nr:hydrolase [Syntrophales bacterium]
MLTLENMALIVVDFQGNLAHSMYEKHQLFENAQKIIKGASVFGIPILAVEQTPDKLGSTIPEIDNLLSGIQHISKTNFNCCDNERFMRELKSLNRNQLLLTGIETHICVYQTTMGLLNMDYEVHIIADAVSSRTVRNRNIGLEKMQDGGASLTSTEIVLFELLKSAEHEKFREVIKIVK